MSSVTIRLKKLSGNLFSNVDRTSELLEVWDGRHTFIKLLFIDIASCIIKAISRDLIRVYAAITLVSSSSGNGISSMESTAVTVSVQEVILR